MWTPPSPPGSKATEYSASVSGRDENICCQWKTSCFLFFSFLFSKFGLHWFFVAGCLITVLRLSCSVACGILVPQPEIEPKFPTLEGAFLTTAPPGKFLDRWNLQGNISPKWSFLYSILRMLVILKLDRMTHKACGNAGFWGPPLELLGVWGRTEHLLL